ncbi:hypothetical protein LFAB_07460 [Lactiplantibacillus fabifermentans T30PCM01]|uniref:Fe3+ hydroxamate ABC transporter substrate-binding protein n=1 Tax=Lactiplantibacillus fabifermentans T30PCM01 TaxID=1400520 RepID=W6T7W7_9LACO|nr:hypothetical protein LFAB_07460 [Lactiplantibacillus fabifermentans T30PCM01]
MLICQNCGQVIKKWDKAYFLLEVPPRSLTEIRNFLATNSVVYCPNCVQVLRHPTVV